MPGGASSGASSRTATTSWRRAQSASASCQPGVEEVGDEEEDRAPPDDARRELERRPRRRSERGVPGSARQSRTMRSACARPFRGRHVLVDAVAERDQPDLVVVAAPPRARGTRRRAPRPARADHAPKPPRHRGRQVEQEEHGELALVDVLLDVGPADARGHVPVDARADRRPRRTRAPRRTRLPEPRNTDV